MTGNASSPYKKTCKGMKCIIAQATARRAQKINGVTPLTFPRTKAALLSTTRE
jgi:hypothetical protein